MPDRTGPVHVVRSAYGRALVVAVVLVVLAAVVAVVADDLADLPVAVPWGAWVVLVAWATFWRPALLVDDDGVVVRNVLATVTVPRAALREVRVRWGLELVTDGGRTVGAWAAPTSSAVARRRGDAGRGGPAEEGAALVRPLVVAGRAAAPTADEAARVTTRVHLATATGLLALPVLAVLVGALR